MGDVKLAGVMGLCLGTAVAPAILLALLSGVLVGVVIISRKGAQEGRKTAVPFGPFLAFGALIAIFVGPEIVDTLHQSLSALKRRGVAADTPRAAPKAIRHKRAITDETSLDFPPDCRTST